MEIRFNLFHENEKAQLNEKKDLPSTKVLLDFLQGVNGLNHENEKAQLNEKNIFTLHKSFVGLSSKCKWFES